MTALADIVADINMITVAGSVITDTATKVAPVVQVITRQIIVALVDFLVSQLKGLLERLAIDLMGLVPTAKQKNHYTLTNT
jgi:hypothetical protein